MTASGAREWPHRLPGSTFVLRELLLPSTDRLVFIEIAVVIVLMFVTLAMLQRSTLQRGGRELQQLTVGVALVLLAWFAIRAVH